MIVAPIAGVTRTSPLVSEHWQVLSAYALLILAGALALALVLSAEPLLRQRLLADNLYSVLPPRLSSLPPHRIERLLQRLHRFFFVLGLFYMFLYCAAIALCLRLHVCLIEQLLEAIEPGLRMLGLAVTALAVFLQLKAVLQSFPPGSGSGGKPGAEELKEEDLLAPLFNIRHPILFGWLLELLGLPLVFGVWLPLSALPGCYVGMMWWVRHQEHHLSARFGEAYARLSKETWCIVPGLKN